MERDKAKGYLNITHKGGYLIIGSDKLDGYDKKLYLTLLDNTVGKTGEKIAQRLLERGVRIVRVDNLEELSSIKNCKILAVKNKNLADIIYELLK